MLVVFSAVARIQYPDADVDRVRAFRRHRVRHQSAPDGATPGALHHRRLDFLRHRLFASAALPPPDNATVAGSHRNLVNTSVVPKGVKVKKVKAFPYSTPSVGPGADPGVQAVSPQVTVSHQPGGRLPLLSTRPAVTFSAAEHHRPLAGTKLYCLVTEAHRCEQLAQGCYAALPRVGFEPATY